MHKPTVTVRLTGDAEEILRFCQGLRSLELHSAAVNAVVKQVQGRGYTDFTFLGIKDGSAEEGIRNIGQLEHQGRVDREQADKLCSLLADFAKLQR